MESTREGEQIQETLLERGLIINPRGVVDDYCRVEGGELLFWDPSTFPVEAADEKIFDEAV